jgi:hypothetical protein
MNDVWYNIGSYILHLFQKLPLGFHYGVGRCFEFVTKYLIGYRRDVIITNLSRSFPEKKYDEIEQLKDEAYRYMGEIFAEAMWYGGCRNNPERFENQNLIEIDEADIQILRNLYKSKPGLMLLNSHLGNWEITAAIFSSLNRFFSKEEIEKIKEATCVVYKRLSNPFWDRFIGENRQATLDGTFHGYIESSNILRHAMMNKNKKSIYLFPTDQYPYYLSKMHEIPSFMNQKTETMAGGAILAHKLGLAVFELCFVRKERGHYKVKFEKICDDASECTAMNIMESYYSILEKYIKSDPSIYLWSHKRWR